MAFYKICPSCKGNLDPGEKCDCEQVLADKYNFLNDLTKLDKDGQFVLDIALSMEESLCNVRRKCIV